MSYLPIIIGAIAIIVAAAFLWSQRDKGTSGTSAAPKRTDLLVGYYGSVGNQVAETADHVNLHWECFWGGLDAAIERLKATQAKAVVLDVADYMFEPVGKVKQLKVGAYVELCALFTRLQNEGVLHKVTHVTPIDEPNLPENAVSAYIEAAVGIIRMVLDKFGLPAKLLCTYYSRLPFCRTDLFDAVGFDAYEGEANILLPGGQYDAFADALKPEQQLILYPGATYGQDPAPFVDYAQCHPRVAIIAAFLWRNPHAGNEFNGIVDTPLADAYRAAFKGVIDG